MKHLAALFLVLSLPPLASAQTPTTYKCWCTLHGGAEKEYTVPGNIYQEATIPIEVPEYGRVICTVTQNDPQEKTQMMSGGPATLSVSLASMQQLQATKEGSYVPMLIMSAGFVPAYNKRIPVLDTPAYSISVELIKG